MKRIMTILCVMALTLPGNISSHVFSRGAIEICAGEQPDVPFVPTPQDVVDDMLSFAGVTAKDVVYDLGCGDGRIAVSAARKGARCVGVDIDPRRITECHTNASRAKVEERVRFLQQDIFNTDLSEATVVTMYLLPEVNLRLRPRILRQLKPGARVVSHDFDMQQWEPDRMITLDSHDIYYWVVPANASGTWEWTLPGENGTEKYTLQIRQKFQKVQGKLLMGDRELPMKDVTLEGRNLRFVLEQNGSGRKTPFEFKGIVAGNAIAGTIATPGGAEYQWRARRNPATIKPIDA